MGRRCSRRSGTRTSCSRGRRADAALRRPAPRARGHVAAGVRGTAAGRAPGAAPRADRRDDGPQRADAAGPVTDPMAKAQLDALRANCEEFGVELHGRGRARGDRPRDRPELGLTQPGKTIVCGDSHTSTHGAFGALAFGIGTSEVEHVLATQTIAAAPPEDDAARVRRRRCRRADGEGPDPRRHRPGRRRRRRRPRRRVRGRGDPGLSMEERMTICNMSIEWGARAGMIAPDETTFAYLEGREFARRARTGSGRSRTGARARERPDAPFDTHVIVDVAELVPQVTWGTNPGMVVPVTGSVPDPGDVRRPRRPRRGRARARVHGPPAGRARSRTSASTACSSAPARTRGSRTCVPPRRSSRGARRPARDGARRARLGAGAPPGRGGGPRPHLPRRRLRVAARRLLDVPRDEPRRARAGRALRLDVQPELRGSPGRGGRTHLVSPQMAAAAALHGHFVDVRTLEREPVPA